MVYYHLTSLKNLKGILSKGLTLGSKKTFGFSGEGAGKIFLGRTPDESWSQVGDPDWEDYGWEGEDWALLEVNLPNDWPLSYDGWGYLYSSKPIPTDRLSLVYVGKALPWNPDEVLKIGGLGR